MEGGGRGEGGVIGLVVSLGSLARYLRWFNDDGDDYDDTYSFWTICMLRPRFSSAWLSATRVVLVLFRCRVQEPLLRYTDALGSLARNATASIAKSTRCEPGRPDLT